MPDPLVLQMWCLWISAWHLRYLVSYLVLLSLHIFLYEDVFGASAAFQEARQFAEA